MITGIKTEPEKTILVVDDEKPFTEMMKKVLIERGYDVMTASNGEEALAAIARQKPDLILLDIKMPKMGGLAFYDRICLPNCEPMYPILVITASDHLEELFQSLPVEGFLLKPVKIEEMLEKVKAVFTKRKKGVSAEREQEALRERKVLIVDNNAEMLQKLSLMFLNRGYTVSIAKTATEVIAKMVNPDSPDMILIRQGMPQQPEYTVSYHLKGIPTARHVNVVVYTEDIQALDPKTEKEILEFISAKNLLETKDLDYFIKSCERIMHTKEAAESQ